MKVCNLQKNQNKFMKKKKQQRQCCKNLYGVLNLQGSIF